MKGKHIFWVRILRRGTALFMATVAVWLLLTAAGLGMAADAFQSLGEQAGFVSALLRAELGSTAAGTQGELDGWGRMVLGQSALLRGNAAAVAAHLENPGVGPTVKQPAGGSSAQGDPLNPAKEDPDEETPIPSAPATPDDIVPYTFIPTSTEGYAYADGVYISNRTHLTFDPAALSAAAVNIGLGSSDAPQILIMHTHATEAYTPSGTDVYTPTDNSRTLDGEQNMVRVGNEMKAVFESMGLNVLHDETPYDYPLYKDSYVRSGEGVKKYLEQYPSIKIVLDVHRDAIFDTNGKVLKPLTPIDGAKVAQVELVLGSPQGGDYPNWQENLTLAMKLQKSMNTLYPTLARPVSIYTPVYNQNLTTGSLLVEVGSHGNTLQESIAGARLFARAAGQVLLGLEQ